MNQVLKRELERLRQQVAPLAAAVKTAMENSINALQSANHASARAVIGGDEAINQKRYSIEKDTVAVLATQQPMAGDLRLLIGILEIATEMERMGDYAKDIARITCRLPNHQRPELGQLPSMSGVATAMLDRVVEAFSQNDEELAASVAREDDRVDQMCQVVHRELVARAREEGGYLDEALALLQVTHNVERYADRVTNLCECVVYIATGEHVEFEDPSEV